MKARRLGAKLCATDVNCPGVFELPDGRIAVVGKAEDVPGVGRVAVLPREVFDKAREATGD